MVALRELLIRTIGAIERPSAAQRTLLDKLDELRSRLDQGLLRVAVLGQFKRGKSSLLNALLGAAVLPTGVTPVTAIPTFIRSGALTRGVIAFAHGDDPLIVTDADELPKVIERHVSEEMNPRNRLGVASVTIDLASPVLDRGVVLIDTPGIGSTFLHNTRAAEAVLAECDAALFVLSTDPPITEGEAVYLDNVRTLIPKILFVLNKIDLLDIDERAIAERFLARVLAERYPNEPPARIFALSARGALAAKQAGDVAALEGSGLPVLERALVEDLAREKQDILAATGRLRLATLVDQLRFQTELERKALLTPEAELQRKAAIFENSARDFVAQRDALADMLSIDCKRLLRELEVETDRAWNDAKREVHRIADAAGSPHYGHDTIRTEIAEALSVHFEQAFADCSAHFRQRVQERAAAHEDRAQLLIARVHQATADLMDIPINLPESREAYVPKRDAYWVGVEASMSLVDITATAATRLLPRRMRERRQRTQIVLDAEKAALRNVANLDWALRQNIEESFRRFGSTLSADLDAAIEATREAMRFAMRRRADRVEEVEEDLKAAERSLAELTEILSALQALGAQRVRIEN